MRFNFFVLRAASALVTLPIAFARQPTSTTIVSGKVVDAGSRLPLGGAFISFQTAKDTVRTDSTGHFRISVPRTASILLVWKDRYQDFKFPDATLTTETLRADIELRADPPARTRVPSGAMIVPFLWIVRDAPDTLRVLDSSLRLLYPESLYVTYRSQSHPQTGMSYGLAGSNGVIVAIKK